jgi:hypothetical protein
MSEQARIGAGVAVQRLINTAEHLRKAHERLVTEWSPDVPPLTIVFSTLGRSLCNYALTSSETELVATCTTIEDLVIQGDDMVKDAVTTGMLEAMLAESSAGRFELSTLTSFLGPETKAYCRSWDKFTGNKTPGLSE